MPQKDLTRREGIGLQVREIVWGVLVFGVFLVWFCSLCPGCWLSDSFSNYGKLEQDGYDQTFSYLYQLPLHVLYNAGLSIRQIAVIVFAGQLGFLYSLIFFVGRYLMRSGSSATAWVFGLLTLINPVFPLMFSMQSVNTLANLLLALFVFLTYRIIRRGSDALAQAYAVGGLGAALIALRLDMAPSVVIAYVMILARMGSGPSAKKNRVLLGSVIISSIVILNVALPRLLDYRPASSSYLLSLIYRPLDKILSSNPDLLKDPSVRLPIEAVIRMPAEKLIGHGEEMYWLDIDRQPSPEVAWRQEMVFFRLVTQRFEVFLGDRASMLIELLGSHRTSFVDDHLILVETTPFESIVSRWGLRSSHIFDIETVRDCIRKFLPVWSLSSPTYWLWNMLPYFLILITTVCFYPFVPATAAVAMLLVARSIVLALLAPYGFYYYSTSLYLVGLLMIVPFVQLELRGRSNSIA